MDDPPPLVVSGVKSSGFGALTWLERAVIETGSLEAPSVPEKEGLPPLECEGVLLGRR